MRCAAWYSTTRFIPRQSLEQQIASLQDEIRNKQEDSGDSKVLREAKKASEAAVKTLTMAFQVQLKKMDDDIHRLKQDFKASAIKSEVPRRVRELPCGKVL